MPARTYASKLRCPACNVCSPQQMLRARQIVPMPVPGKVFHRAFCWAQGRPTAEDSPLYHGICLCPECRYPGLESDFQPKPELSPPNVRSLQKRFVVERAGRSREMSTILTARPSALPQPERALRLLFASMRSEMLSYPEFWRKDILGHLYQRVAWIHFDLLHLDWSKGDLTGPPDYMEIGPNAGTLQRTTRTMISLLRLWPELPLDETTAFTEALKWFEQHYQTRGEEAGAEALAREELRIARLNGLLGNMEISRDLYDRARETAFLGREETVRNRDVLWNGKEGDIAQWRALGITARRLLLLTGEIHEERVSIFGSPMYNRSSGRRGRNAA